MICPWVGNLTANFWKMSNPHPMPCLPPRRLYIDGCIIARVVPTYCCLLLIIVSIWSITYHFLLRLHKGESKTSLCFSFSIIYSFLLIDLNPKQWPTRKPKLLWSLFTIYVSCCSSFFFLFFCCSVIETSCNRAKLQQSDSWGNLLCKSKLKCTCQKNQFWSSLQGRPRTETFQARQKYLSL